MKKNELEDGVPKGVPANLAELIGGPHEGYVLKWGYVLQLKHGLMGYFPAIVKNTKLQILSTDVELLKRVWKMLTPRQSEMTACLLYLNEKLQIAFPVLGTDQFYLKESQPLRLFLQADFDELTVGGKNPFGWAPGLVGDDMNLQEFRETIEAAAKEHGVSLS